MERTKYAAEFKSEAVKQVIDKGHPVVDVAKLSVSTLGAYMGLTRKVLQHAARHSFIQHIPEFPKVGIEDKPRG